MTKNNLTINGIKDLMKPIHSDNHPHTALIDHKEDRRAINIALLRWAGGAKQITLTKWELPPDAVGRIYTVDTFIGEIVDTKYAEWAKGVRRGAYEYTGTSHTKGKYKTFPQVQFDYICNSRKRRHYRPFIHSVIAYVLPELREQYAQAALREQDLNNKDFIHANVQVNHMDKHTHNNSSFNLEVVTAKENSRHKYLTPHGLSLSALRHFGFAQKDLAEYDGCGVIDADAWAEKICKQLSGANLPPKTEVINVINVRGIEEAIDISGSTVWGIITHLFLRQTYSLGLNQHLII